MITFTNDEMNMVCIYRSDTRIGVISELEEMKQYLDSDETELKELTDSTIAKLHKLTDEEFDSLSLCPDFNL